jgi:quinol monooxygenase YgiN
MISITASFSIMPGKEAEAEAAIRKVADAVSEKEPGCLVYTWHRGVKDPMQVLVFENWRDDEALKEHRTQPHMAEFSGLFGTVFDPASVKIDRWEKFASLSR